MLEESHKLVAIDEVANHWIEHCLCGKIAVYRVHYNSHVTLKDQGTSELPGLGG
jgi:hypothetical protein